MRRALKEERSDALFDGRLNGNDGREARHFAGHDFHLSERRELVRAQHALGASFLKLRGAKRGDDDELEGISERGSVYHRTTIA